MRGKSAVIFRINFQQAKCIFAIMPYHKNKFTTSQEHFLKRIKMTQRTDKKTICLNMTVVNESAIIRDNRRTLLLMFH